MSRSPRALLPRRVEPETLDALAEDDARAVRSRRDLRRINRAIGSRGILARALRPLAASRAPAEPMRVLELGAGDGRLMLGVASDLRHAWPAVELTLLDRQALVDDATLAAYRKLGWAARSCVADVFEWAGDRAPPAGLAGGDSRFDLIVTNLFLHHFQGPALMLLCAAIAARCDAFFACEPRRAWLALAGSHLVGALGANAVTRADAVTSVHAGFRDREISPLWPAEGWQRREYAKGLFSHCFVARRIDATGDREP